MNKARVIVISKVATAMDWIVRYQQASRGLVTIDTGASGALGVPLTRQLIAPATRLSA